MHDDHSEALRLLVQRIKQQQQLQCQQILDEARNRAAELLAAATAEAEKREAAALAAEQQRLAETEATLQARQATEQRQQRLLQTRALLERGWQRLLENVQRRWDNQAQRAHWLTMLLQKAQQTFHHADWLILHPQEWNPEEWRAQLPSARFQVDTELTAGVKICCKGVWLDGSLQGMITSQRELSGLLLAQLAIDEETS
ncbi:hypothetical protein [Candidatus Magnetaquicoccus inordinatus]|uniref:hypothetical protein n=1 Tax=Candidatus Magnetaquicoccus inordinatus TaxID=2496818 RepID=UPI00102C26CA|nr:hypothetical protein [Candidatus Magnetaquicoccus inordinatus]